MAWRTTGQYCSSYSFVVYITLSACLNLETEVFPGYSKCYLTYLV